MQGGTEKEKQYIIIIFCVCHPYRPFYNFFAVPFCLLKSRAKWKREGGDGRSTDQSNSRDGWLLWRN